MRQAGQTRRVEAPEVRRAQIVEAAKRRFRESGFHVTTMADIAAAAGVSVGLLYRYFPGKDDIIREIVETDLRAQLAAVEAALAGREDDPAAALDTLIDELGRLATDRDRTGLMVEIVAEVARNPGLMALAAPLEQRVLALMAGGFGAALPAAEREVRLRMAFNLFTAFGLQAYRDPSSQELAMRLTAQAVRQVLGMAPPA